MPINCSNQALYLKLFPVVHVASIHCPSCTSFRAAALYGEVLSILQNATVWADTYIADDGSNAGTSGRRLMATPGWNALQYTGMGRHP